MKLKSQIQSMMNQTTRPVTTTATKPKPSWLTTATSQKHISTVLRLLATRESIRHEARSASQQKALEAAGTIPSSKSSVSSGPFWRKEEINPNHVAYYSVATGVHEDYEEMNRYVDIIPYDRTSVIVTEGFLPSPGTAEEGVSQGRYLNANWVLERYGHKWWIAAQAPLRYTAHAFLSVLLQPSVHPPNTKDPRSSGSSPATKTSRVRTIVQLTRNMEGGRKKADAYFPDDIGKSHIILPEEGCHAHPLKVTLLDRRNIQEAHCVQSTVSVVTLQQPNKSTIGTQDSLDEDHCGDVNYGQEIVFNHLLYLSWPDHGVPDPEDRDSLLAFINIVDSVNRDKTRCRVHPTMAPNHECDELDSDPPIVVGCSAGIGRTGSFLALSSLLRHFGFISPAAHPTTAHPVHDSPLGPIPENLRDDLVLQEIDSLREQRPGMVQRTEQVLLVYEVLADAFETKS